MVGGGVWYGGAQDTVSQSFGSPIPSVWGVGWGEATQALGKYVSISLRKLCFALKGVATGRLEPASKSRAGTGTSCLK